MFGIVCHVDLLSLMTNYNSPIHRRFPILTLSHTHQEMALALFQLDFWLDAQWLGGSKKYLPIDTPLLVGLGGITWRDYKLTHTIKIGQKNIQDYLIILLRQHFSVIMPLTFYSKFEQLKFRLYLLNRLLSQHSLPLA